MPRPRIAQFAAATVVAAVIAIALITRPLLLNSDEKLYHDAMNGFLAHGLQFTYSREPGYPLFLAAAQKIGIDPLHHIPLIQNLLFLISLSLLCRTVFAERLSTFGAILIAGVVTLIPTFCITCNGALYTESLSASLIFLQLAAMTYVIRGSTGWRIGLVLLAAFLLSAAQGLIKGSFSFIHFAFCGLGLVWLLITWLKSKKTYPALCCALLLTAAGSHIATKLYLHQQSELAGAPITIYSRGGAIFYGRTQYARQFDFTKDSAPYLLAALSSKAYQKYYGNDGWQYSFDAENQIGLKLLESGQKTDEQLFHDATRDIRETPLRQFAFGFYELAHYFLHHTMQGFATVTNAQLKKIIESDLFALGLKLLNLIMYAIPIALAFRNLRKHGVSGWRVLPSESWSVEHWGVALILLYSAAYLAVYFMASALVRMIWPVAPFLVLLNYRIIRQIVRKATSPPNPSPASVCT